MENGSVGEKGVGEKWIMGSVKEIGVWDEVSGGKRSEGSDVVSWGKGRVAEWIMVMKQFLLQVKDKLRKMGHLQPMNIFLRQEIDRLQKVITSVRNTLQVRKTAPKTRACSA